MPWGAAGAPAGAGASMPWSLEGAAGASVGAGAGVAPGAAYAMQIASRARIDASSVRAPLQSVGGVMGAALVKWKERMVERISRLHVQGKRGVSSLPRGRGGENRAGCSSALQWGTHEGNSVGTSVGTVSGGTPGIVGRVGTSPES